MQKKLLQERPHGVEKEQSRTSGRLINMVDKTPDQFLNTV